MKQLYQRPEIRELTEITMRARKGSYGSETARFEELVAILGKTYTISEIDEAIRRYRRMISGK